MKGRLPMTAHRAGFGKEEDSRSNHGDGDDPERHCCIIVLIQECLRRVVH